ncbi:Reverse transcriptase zinc-binding domain [Macleaya cordata]|uniref:Reverse transcriptase zinc-binding domain n=1 Tax=Macleaya cordata TaxID=56857 RepID=A0A200QL49_MACCD|nr:Reverse transcriptase zinc-binding domain [Macleaya cordata]
MNVDDKYLGHKLLKSKSRIASYDELIDNCRSRLQGWMSKQLSHAGRGGLGFRSPEKVNEALLAKLAWRFLTHTDSYWVKLISARYLQRYDFWTVKKMVNCSPVWTGILIGRDIIAPHVCWSIGDGSLIKIWTDPWVPFLPRFRVEGSSLDRGGLCFVSELICPNSRLWRLDLLQQFFLPHEIIAILKIRLSAEASADTLIWMLTPTGDFSTKSVYKSLLQGEPAHSESSTFSFDWKRFWKMQGISPKVHLFLWRLLHNAIAVKVNIARHGTSVDTYCRLCYKSEETVEHLFLHREVIKKVWFISPIGLRIDSPGITYNIADLFNIWLCLNDAQDAFKLGCAMLWCIWKARNRVMFDNSEFNIGEVVSSAYSLFLDHSSCILTPLHELPIGASSSTEYPTWCPSPAGTLKINVDGAALDKYIVAGIVARNSEGDFIEGRCFFDGDWHGTNGAIEAEARAFLKGLELAQSLQVSSVIIEGDSQLLVSYLLDDRLKYPWRIRSIILDCRRLMSYFSNISIKFVLRLANKSTHHLAQYAVSSTNGTIWKGDPSSCIVSHLSTEKPSLIN